MSRVLVLAVGPMKDIADSARMAVEGSDDEYPSTTYREAHRPAPARDGGKPWWLITDISGRPLPTTGKPPLFESIRHRGVDIYDEETGGSQ
jgi:hypothetical protein